MKYDLTEFDKLVNEGFIRRVEKGDLVLYNYTDKCVYERHWNEYTKAARGIIFEKSTGRLVAKPFPKFFNLGEMPETQLLNLPNEPYTVLEKVDGSLGIIYHYNGKWNVATRGSFDSEQAVKATELLNKYDLNCVPINQTILVEIIYPENKIVVDYNKKEELVLLGIVDTDAGRDVFGSCIGLVLSGIYLNMRVAESFYYNIDEMISLQKTLPKDQEGFVVRFQGGLRVKIKGEEYMRVHKMISTMSPLSFWESMIDGVVNREYLSQLPEEFRNEFEPMVERLEQRYQEVLKEIEFDVLKLPATDASKESCKAVGLFIAPPNELRHPGAMFSKILGKKDALNKYIMKTIRPTGNVL